ncbi:MAG: XdhC family protein [Bdellovibrionales bacterium]|nr:XdhC family protein [Bdellovibrionales bacterium]
MNAVNFWQAAAELESAGTPFVVVTMAGTRGHAPQDPGAKILVTSDGLHFGTVGGGKVEAKCIEEAKRILALPPGDSPTLLYTWNLQRDVGMTCGGEVTYLFERREAASWPIVVFGAGHVAQALARILETLACRATFVDSRSEWIERTPLGSGKLRTAAVAEPVDYVKHLKGDEFVVVTTRGHATDLPVLKALYAREREEGLRFPYIGGIGSDVKALKLRKELGEFGVPAERIREFHCPIGLPLGGNDPAEIAISIAAELIQCRDSSR